MLYLKAAICKSFKKSFTKKLRSSKASHFFNKQVIKNLRKALLNVLESFDNKKALLHIKELKFLLKQQLWLTVLINLIPSMSVCIVLYLTYVTEYRCLLHFQYSVQAIKLTKVHSAATIPTYYMHMYVYTYTFTQIHT